MLLFGHFAPNLSEETGVTMATMSGGPPHECCTNNSNSTAQYIMDSSAPYRRKYVKTLLRTSLLCPLLHISSSCLQLCLGLVFPTSGLCRVDLHPVEYQLLLEGDPHDLVLLAAVTEGADKVGVNILA